MTYLADQGLEAVAAATAVLGAFFFIVGTVGLLRFPDFYCRNHATAKCDTLGAGLLLLALVMHAGISPETPKLLLLMVLIAVYSPLSNNALARAAYRAGLAPTGADG